MTTIKSSQATNVGSVQYHSVLLFISVTFYLLMLSFYVCLDMPHGKTALMKALLNLKHGKNDIVEHLLNIARRMGDLKDLVNAECTDPYYKG